MKRLLELKEEFEHTLHNNILKYWIENSVDNENGGFIGHINSDNTTESKANKGVILNARILWTFSKSYRESGGSDYLWMADRAYNYIKNNFRDCKNGGLFWELNYLGQPVNKRKQIYAQAFTIYALSEYYMINKNQEVLKWAVELFELIEKYSRDKVHGGYIEAYDEDWSEINDVRLSEKDANEKKTMNTHLHLLEAYTNLIRVWPNEELIGAQKELIYLFLNIFINKDDHLKLFFNELWETKSSTISFGHDIEASWLLTEAAEIVGGKEIINACKQAAVKITDAVISVGTDSDGSIFNEREGANGCFDYDKHWWQQAEGMVGFMNSYQISGDDKYLESILHIWKFIKDKIIDYKNGEWYWKVNRTGERFPEDEKAGFWKCPYHNSRACIEMINRIKSQES